MNNSIKCLSLKTCKSVEKGGNKMCAHNNLSKRTDGSKFKILSVYN